MRGWREDGKCGAEAKGKGVLEYSGLREEGEQVGVNNSLEKFLCDVDLKVNVAVSNGEHDSFKNSPAIIRFLMIIRNCEKLTRRDNLRTLMDTGTSARLCLEIPIIS